MNFLDFPCTILEISIPFALSRFSANFGVKILLADLSCVTESCFFFFCRGIRQLPRRRGARATLQGKSSFTIHTCYIGPDWCSWVETEYQRGNFNSTLARFPFAVRYPTLSRLKQSLPTLSYICMTYANLPMTLTGTCNSTDERPGLKRLLRNSSQNRALLFIIFWKFPYLPHEGCVRLTIFRNKNTQNFCCKSLRQVYRDFWATQTLHTSGYLFSSRFLDIAMQWEAKQVISRVNSF